MDTFINSLVNAIASLQISPQEMITDSLEDGEPREVTYSFRDGLQSLEDASDIFAKLRTESVNCDLLLANMLHMTLDHMRMISHEPGHIHTWMIEIPWKPTLLDGFSEFTRILDVVFLGGILYVTGFTPDDSMYAAGIYIEVFTDASKVPADSQYVGSFTRDLNRYHLFSVPNVE